MKCCVKVSKEKFLWTLILAPLLKPNGIPNINATVSKCYDIGIIVSFLILVYLLFRRRKTNIVNIILTTIFVGWITILTIFNNGQTTLMVRISMQYIGLAMATCILSDKSKILFSSMLLNLEILIYLNFICLLVFPNGMYVSSQTGNWNNWLLGYDNHWFIVLFAAMFIALIYLRIYKKTIRPLLLIIVIHISASIVMSGVITFGLIVIDVMFITHLYKSKVVTYRNIWLITLVANILIVFYSTSGIATFIVYNLFNKTSTTIPARLKIWFSSIELIKESLLVGYGHPETAERIAIYNNRHASNAHNFLIEIVYEGGLIGLGLFGGLIYQTGKKLNEFKKRNIELHGIVLVCLLACLITGSVDSLLESRGALFFWMLSVGSNISMLGRCFLEA